MVSDTVGLPRDGTPSGHRKVGEVDLAIVVGNPRPRSRTRRVAEAVGLRVASVTGVTTTRVVDLCDYGHDLFRWPHGGLSAVAATVAESDVIVVASPTYKAAYTGLLKAFLDRYPSNGLAGVTAVPVMTGGSETHAMAVEASLRPVLVELGASLPTRGLFVLMSDMSDVDAAVDAWAGENLRLIRLG